MTTIGNDSIRWRQYKRLLKQGKLTPIIGDRVGHDGFLTSDTLIQQWATMVGYPMANTRSITRVAQYYSVKYSLASSKYDYLDFLKEYLFGKVLERQGASSFLQQLEAELDALPFSEVAKRLKYPEFNENIPNPLEILAQFDLPIYITTNYHPFMAQALERTGAKTPRLEACPWNKGGNFDSLFDDEDYQDDPEKPVVYHLHGIDRDETSLVLTEDDYLDFLVAVTRDPALIPYRVQEAMVDSVLLLLGFELEDWDFRVLFRGLIKPKPPQNRPEGICIQVDPSSKGATEIRRYEEYLEKYFGHYNINVFWGKTEEFIETLWRELG